MNGHFRLTLLAMTALAAYAAHADYHVADLVRGNTTYLDPNVFGRNPYSQVFVVQVYSTPKYPKEAVRNPNAIGVRFDTSEGKWAIYNLNGAAMPPRAKFWVDVAEHHARVHCANANPSLAPTNIHGGKTYIDTQILNGHPEFPLIVMPVLNPTVDSRDRPYPTCGDGSPGAMTPTNVIAGYDNEKGKWYLANQDGSPVRDTARFFILDHYAESTAMYPTHVSTSRNIDVESGFFTTTELTVHELVTHSVPRFLTPHFGNSGQSCSYVGTPLRFCWPTGVYNDSPIGVAYDYGANKWAIINLALRQMPRGATFQLGRYSRDPDR